VSAVEGWLHVRRRWRGINRFPDPTAYFGAGGVEEAERLCAEANRDLLGFLRPPPEVPVANVDTRCVSRARSRVRVDEWAFDSPLPSGDPANDRVQVRLLTHPSASRDGRVVVFHHPIYQRDWGVWGWFLAPLIREVPVAMMAAPHHFRRQGRGRYPGEMSMNPNPARLFEAIRQWCWDHVALERALSECAGLHTSAIVGYSFGAFQSLLLAAAGRLDVPIVSIASTNRYAYGLCNGLLGKGVLDGMRRVGIDRDKLERLVDSLQLERHVSGLRDRRILYVRGIHDGIDPHPSLERLERALEPERALRLDAGHGTLLLLRERILSAALGFLRAHGAIAAPAARTGRASMAS